MRSALAPALSLPESFFCWQSAVVEREVLRARPDRGARGPACGESADPKGRSGSALELAWGGGGARELPQFGEQVRWVEVRVSLQHLHALVPRYAGHFQRV